jgi:hypothetical protein
LETYSDIQQSLRYFSGMAQSFEEYSGKLERFSIDHKSEAGCLALMLLYVERQRPSCVALQRRLQLDLRYLYFSIDQLWQHLAEQRLTNDQLVSMREEIVNLAEISEAEDARSALPTVGVALNTCSAILKAIDFVVFERQNSLALCGQCCLEAVREEVYFEYYLDLLKSRGKDRLFAERNTVQYAREIQELTRAAFRDLRTQAEIAAQLDLAQRILQMRASDRKGLYEMRSLALPAGVNSLGYGLGNGA